MRRKLAIISRSSRRIGKAIALQLPALNVPATFHIVTSAAAVASFPE